MIPRILAALLNTFGRITGIDPLSLLDADYRAAKRAVAKAKRHHRHRRAASEALQSRVHQMLRKG